MIKKMMKHEQSHCVCTLLAACETDSTLTLQTPLFKKRDGEGLASHVGHTVFMDFI